MPELNNNPSLADFQAYVVDMKKERGFDTSDKIHECFLLVEEIGELFKAVRKSENWPMDAKSRVTPVSEELADCFIFLLSIANQHGIDLEQAFREKEEINKKRVWQPRADSPGV